MAAAASARERGAVVQAPWPVPDAADVVCSFLHSVDIFKLRAVNRPVRDCITTRDLLWGPMKNRMFPLPTHDEGFVRPMWMIELELRQNPFLRAYFNENRKQLIHQCYERTAKKRSGSGANFNEPKQNLTHRLSQKHAL